MLQLHQQVYNSCMKISKKKGLDQIQYKVDRCIGFKNEGRFTVKVRNGHLMEGED